jgi:hypothetical protein
MQTAQVRLAHKGTSNIRKKYYLCIVNEGNTAMTKKQYISQLTQNVEGERKTYSLEGASEQLFKK